MSQHIIDGTSSNDHVTVGYDRRLNNFFGMVMRDGNYIHHLQDAEDTNALQTGMTEYATIDQATITLLEQEQRGDAPTNASTDRRASANSSS